MKKALKIIASGLVILLLLVVITVISLITFVNPNRFKPVLIQQVMKHTGRQLVIDGDMGWTFFPYLGVKVGHSSLSNLDDFNEKTFAEISHLTVAVKILPLLQRKLESNGIVLTGMKLHLLKNKSGKVNWDFRSSESKENSHRSSTAASTQQAIMGLAVSGLEIMNAEIDYLDETTNNYYEITQFAFHAKDINLMQPFPIQASFNFTTNQPAISGQVNLNSDIALNVTTQIYAFRNVKLLADIKKNNKKINLQMMGNVLADLNQENLQWTDLNAKVANITMLGKINVSHLKTAPVAIGHLQLQPFDLRETFKNLGEDVTNLQAAKNTSGEIDFTASKDGLKLQSNLGIDLLQAAKLTLTNVNVKAHLEKGILDLAPIAANLYQGNLTSQAIIDLNSAAPKINLHAKLANIQAQPLLQDLREKEQKITLAGLGNLEIQMTTAGVESKALLQNLNGIMQVDFKNGAIIGIDLGYLVDTAYALIKGNPATATNKNQTNFGTLTATAIIHGGIISNNDLVSDTPRFAIRGAGTVDLMQQKINYALQTVIKQRSDQKDNLMNLYGITLPVLITGDLNDPSVRLDSAVVAKALAQQQIKKVTNQAKEKLQEQLQKQLPGKAGELLKGKAGDVLNNLLGN